MDDPYITHHTYTRKNKLSTLNDDSKPFCGDLPLPKFWYAKLIYCIGIPRCKKITPPQNNRDKGALQEKQNCCKRVLPQSKKVQSYLLTFTSLELMGNGSRKESVIPIIIVVIHLLSITKYLYYSLSTYHTHTQYLAS